MLIVIFLLLSLLFPRPLHAAEQNFVTPVFPVRGRDYWRERGDPKHLTALKQIVLDSRLPATWLIHYDVLKDQLVLGEIKSLPENQEVGLFLEVTRQLAEDSFVLYDWENDPWSSAHKLFLSGYSLSDRKKLIDQSFTSFKDAFGYYPHSYGAWYVDVLSMEYIKQQYGADITLGLADQYSTDGYQTWGQYINQPYFVSQKSAIEPAASEEDSTSVLKVLWAPREPTLSFGDSVEQSNFSLQLNDYYRSKGLPHSYFTKLLKDSTLGVTGPLSQVVVGLEVAEVDPVYLVELRRQLQDLKDLQSDTFKVQTLSTFNAQYRQSFPAVSPPLLVTSVTPNQSSYWYFSPFYRLGLFRQNGQVYLRDLRFYHQNLWRDNDQSQIDPRHNLSRLVPALVDQVVYGNQITLGPDTGFAIKEADAGFTISFADQLLRLSPKNPSHPALPLPTALSLRPTQFSSCFAATGGFAPPGSCLKKYLTRAATFIPDLRYSNLAGQRYLGLRRSPTELVGVRFPDLKLGLFDFQFDVLENFISLRKKLTPTFPWFGKQEFEIYNKSGTTVAKDGLYGQDNLRKIEAEDKLFENGYYLLLKDTPN